MGIFGFFKARPPVNQVELKVFAEGSPHKQYKVITNEGANLLDTLNEMNMKDLSVFGICEKQLACHSCRVNFISKFESLNEPAEEEKDVLDDLGKLFRAK